MSNPYAPPQAVVQDIVDPSADIVAAGRGTRLGAAILDGITFGALVYLPVMLGLLLSGLTDRAFVGERPTEGLGIGLGFGALGFATWLALTIRSVKRNSQTLGKKILNIKVVRSDGSPVSLGRLFWLRNVVNGLLALIPLYGLIDLLFIFGESRQCLHDKIADTIVIQA